jgi:hypothetical protein
VSIPLKLQVLNRINGDATLTGLLASGEVYPRAGGDPDTETAPPFVVLQWGNETVVDELTGRQFGTVYIYDDPLAGWGYWRIDKIALRVRQLFDGYEGFSFAGRNWGRCTYDGTSEEQTDDEWHKLMKWVRFSVPGV